MKDEILIAWLPGLLGIGFLVCPYIEEATDRAIIGKAPFQYQERWMVYVGIFLLCVEAFVDITVNI